MKREIGWDDIERDDAAVVTVGTFDGVHRGHQTIVRYLLQRAAVNDGTSTVVSFDPHPRTVVHGEAVPLLTTIEERAALLEDLGVDRFVVIPFDEDFAQLSATAYVEDVLVERIGLQEITVGYDHAFGKGREGDVELLAELGTEHGFAVDVIPAQEVNTGVVSSSAIRRLLREEGDATRAREMLGRPYRLCGRVERGAGRGRKIGYPTANIAIDEADKLTPRIGVYATRVRLCETGTTYGGMMNIGRRPTFENMEVTVEVHLLGFSGDLYDQRICVEFLQRLRDERKFESAEALALQLSRDERHCKTVIEAID